MGVDAQQKTKTLAREKITASEGDEVNDSLIVSYCIAATKNTQAFCRSSVVVTAKTSDFFIDFRNTTVGLEHVETPVDMKLWPQFHNGVAAGLRIAQGISQVCMHGGQAFDMAMFCFDFSAYLFAQN